jgi:urea transport system permease protein
VWTAVGGRGTIFGPILGAVLVNAAKSWFTGVLPELWLFALGGLFVLVTVALPKGIVGTAVEAWRTARARGPAMAVSPQLASAEAAPPRPAE